MLQPALNQVKLSRRQRLSCRVPYSASLQRLITFTGLCSALGPKYAVYVFYFSGIITHFLWQRSLFQVCENMEAWSIWQLIHYDTVTTTTSLLNHCYIIITYHYYITHHHINITATSPSLLHHCYITTIYIITTTSLLITTTSLLHQYYITTTTKATTRTHNPQPSAQNPQPNLQPLPPPRRNRC